MLEKPKYYNNGKIDVIEFIYQIIPKNMVPGDVFCVGNIIKYVVRFPNKNGLEDLYKARVYLNRLIKKHEHSLRKNVVKTLGDFKAESKKDVAPSSIQAIRDYRSALIKSVADVNGDVPRAVVCMHGRYTQKDPLVQRAAKVLSVDQKNDIIHEVLIMAKNGALKNQKPM